MDGTDDTATDDTSDAAEIAPAKRKRGKRGPHAEQGVKVRERKGAWWLFVDFKGQRRARRIGAGPAGKKLALQAMIQVRSKLALGDLSMFQKTAPAAPVAAVPTFADVAAEWLQKYPALHPLKPTTLENYRSAVERHLLPFFGTLAITGVTPTKIEDFIEAKRASGGSCRWQGKGLSDVTLRAILEPLKMILHRARKRELISENPLDVVDWTSQRRPDNADPFASAELRRILEAAPSVSPAFAVMLRFWAQTGARAGEVFGLQQHDLNFDKGTVLIRRTLTRGRLGSPKTGDVVPLAEVLEHLRRRGRP